MLFSGALTALVTPFRNNSLDEATYRAFIEHQINAGIHGLVPCGTTGESATLSHEEHERVIEICIDQAKGRVPVLAGAGSNNTTEAIRLARFAQKAGADGALLITPYYNKPTQEGLYQHYKAIAQAVDLPLVPYNVPGRTGCNLLPATLARLAHDFSNIAGVKEATGDMSQASRILESCPEGFCVLSGDDFTALPLMALGGKGHLRHLQRGPRPRGRHGQRLRYGRSARRRPPAPRDLPPARSHVPRKQPHPRQNRPRPHGPHGSRTAPAPLPHER